MIKEYTSNGVTISHPTIMSDGTIQIVVGEDYYEFTMAEILDQTESYQHPEDWSRNKADLGKMFMKTGQQLLE